MHDLITQTYIKSLHELFICTIYLQLMFTQSVIVRGSGFPLFATYVAVIKAAWREVTVSLKEKTTTTPFHFSTNTYRFRSIINSCWATDLRT